jgi:hypothetical protein
MESVVTARGILLLLFALAWLTPQAASAQGVPPPAPPAPIAAGTEADQSKLWIVAGGTATTLRGDCQEGCVAHGTGAYLHTGSVLGMVGYRVHRQMDAGAEVSWVPATAKDGTDIRVTFLLAAAEFRPLASRGLFLKAGMGMAVVRNFVIGESGIAPPIRSRSLGVTYGIGWTFHHDKRVGLQVFGAQHISALGDFQSATTLIPDVVANFWSVGSAIVIR